MLPCLPSAHETQYSYDSSIVKIFLFLVKCLSSASVILAFSSSYSDFFNYTHSHKYVFFDVEGFKFYILTKGLPSFDYVIGFFSKVSLLLHSPSYTLLLHY